MNISYKWLKRYINLTDDAQTVAKILTSIGLEVGTVETVQTIKGGLEGLVVGQVLTCVPHPNSDHLHITTTDYGEGPVQIVCGAPNVAAGQKVIVATIGTRLYSGDESFVIKRGKIRGEESLCMLCAEDEIGVGTSHDGIIVLPEDTPIGMTAKEYYHIEDDTLIEVDITPNRSDGASHYGVARDLYAYYKTAALKDRCVERPGEALKDRCAVRLTKPDVSAFKVDNHDLEIDVKVENTDACPRYSGVSIQGVTVKESPDWLKNALTSIGLRPINNIVDVTNFVLFEMGQALHAFDADKIAGKQIIVKNATQGQKFVTLDGVERELDARDLMICNANEPMCIAGVFGGLDSGVTEATTNVFLESAYFDPVSIRKTARRHQLQTDASFRYERGCDPNNTMYVLQRAALLMQEVAGGTIAMEPVDRCTMHDAQCTSEPFEPFEVEVSLDRVNKLIGKELGKEMIETIMSALEMQFTWQQATGDRLQATGKWLVKVPRYRVDVQRECDVVEDILRIYGYNNIEFPEKVNTNLSYCPKPNVEALQKKVSEQLTAQGFNEIMNNSLTKMSYYMTATLKDRPCGTEGSGEALKDRCAEGQSWLDSCVKIKNPLSQDLGVMRQTLLFGGLESIARNVNRKNSDLRFYEFGNCYHFKKLEVESEREPIEQYSEEMHLGLWLTGNKSKLSWVRKEEKSSFYQLHAYVNAILTRLGVNIDKCSLEPAIDPNGDMSCGIANLFSDGLVIKAPNKAIIGYMAIVSPATRKSFDIDNEVFYADLYWDALVKLNKQYKPVISDLPKFPEVKRDFALLVNKDVEFADLARAAFETERKLLKNVFLFDVYEGKNLEEGKKSYALSFILQNEEDTLKDKQIENIMERLKKTFETKFEAKLR